MKKKFIALRDYITNTWADNDKHPPNIQLDAFIQQAYNEYGLDRNEYPFEASSVHSRIHRGRLEVTQTGQVSPALQVEPRIVMFIKLLTECNNEMTRDEIISFANSYIEGSAVEQQIIKRKLTFHQGWMDYVTQ